jgi:amino acid permease
MNAGDETEETPLCLTVVESHGTCPPTPLENPRASWADTQTGNDYGGSTWLHTEGSYEEMHGSWLEGVLPAGGMGSIVLGLLTSAVTPSMLSIPYAMAVAGTTYGLLCIVVCLALTMNSVRILALASSSAASDDYEFVSYFFLGSGAMWITRGIMFFYNFGAGVVYLRFILDSLEPLLLIVSAYTPPWLHQHQGAVVALCIIVGIVTPLSFKSRIASLRTKGFVANIFVAFIVASIGFRYFYPIERVSKKAAREPELSAPYLPLMMQPMLKYLVAGPIYVFAYEMQSNVLTIFRDLEYPSPSRILVVVVLAMLGATCFYVPLGLFGAWSFGSSTSGNILSNYDASKDQLMFASQLCCCFAACISFIFVLFPCRFSIFMVLTEESTATVRVPYSLRIRIGVTLSLLCCICAIFVPDVAIAVSFLGSCCSATLSMTLPALFALKMRQSGTYFTSWMDGILSWAMLFFGVFFSVSGTIATTLIE